MKIKVFQFFGRFGLIVSLLGVVCFLGCVPWKIPNISDSSIKNNSAQKKSTEIEKIFSVKEPVHSIQLSPDEKRLLVVTGNSFDSVQPSFVQRDALQKLQIWNIDYQRPYQEKREIFDSQIVTMGAVFSNERSELFYATNEQDRTSMQTRSVPNVLDLPLESQEPPRPVLTETEDYRRILLFKGNHWIACQDRNGFWRLHSTLTPERQIFFPVLHLKEKDSQTDLRGFVSNILAISPDGSLVATSVSPENGKRGKNTTVVIWDLKVVGSIPLKDAALPLEALEVSRLQLPEEPTSQQSVFSPDGTIFASRIRPLYVGIWEAASGRLISSPGPHKLPIQSLAIAPTGLTLAVGLGGEKGRIALWDLRKDTMQRAMDDPEPSTRAVSALEYSRDGMRLYYGTDQGEVKLWTIHSIIK